MKSLTTQLPGLKSMWIGIGPVSDAVSTATAQLSQVVSGVVPGSGSPTIFPSANEGGALGSQPSGYSRLVTTLDGDDETLPSGHDREPAVEYGTNAKISVGGLVTLAVVAATAVGGLWAAKWAKRKLGGRS